MLDDVLFFRAREAREAPGGGRGDCERYEEAARHRAAFLGLQLLYALVMAQVQPRVSQQYGEPADDGSTTAFDRCLRDRGV